MFLLRTSSLHHDRMYRSSTTRRLYRELSRAIAYHGEPGRAMLRTVASSPHYTSALVRSIPESFRSDPRATEFTLNALRRLATTSGPTPSDQKKSEATDGSKSSTNSKSSSDAKTESNQKEKPKRDSSGVGDSGKKREPNDDGPNAWMSQLALMVFVVLGFSLLGGQENGKEISFQAFVWDLLEPGLVDRIEVANKSTARVYLKSSGDMATSPYTIQTNGGFPGDNAGEISLERDRAELGGFKRPDRRGETAAAAARAREQKREPKFYFNIGTVDTFERKLEAVQEDLGLEPDDFVSVTYVSESNLTAELFRHLPTLLLLGMGVFMMRNAFGQMGGIGGGRGGIFQVGKANPIVVKAGESGQTISFADVAGLNEAKAEVMEFVDFLKNPGHYEKLGAKIPKGALLVGPPGTGKTLLAKATAGEASVPFFSMSGSDFIEMFVGVGPSRVRDLFAQARSNAPCIVFIDEIDAVGRARGRGGMAGGNDERENTLNALLVEMDGFSTSSGVVVLAGTNRADILDKALLRPGRFDRQINIDKPDMRGRYDIFMVHLRPIKLNGDPSDVAKRLAALTPGFAGADIANICNEAALIAARNDKNAVEMVDFEAATDRVIGGLEKKNKVISKKEREIVAHHEAGHAVCGWFLEHADPLIKVSIIPRGSAALGFAQYLPLDKVLQSEAQIRDFLVMALGGRVAEALCFGSVTTGAQDDLRRVTNAAYAKVTNFGMSDRVGKVYFPKSGESGANQFYKPYSEDTAEIIDDEAARIVDEAYEACEQLLTEKLDVVKELAKQLLEKEVLREEDLISIMGPRQYAKPADYDAFVDRFDDDRRRRTGGMKGGDDGKARDGAHTPPIPTAEGVAEAAKDPSAWSSGSSSSSDGSDESIPELA